MASAIFLLKKVPERKKWHKTWSERGDVIPMPGKKGSGLCLSEKELLEQRSGAFHLKNTPGNSNY
jgi:hypothetical protein